MSLPKLRTTLLMGLVGWMPASLGACVHEAQIVAADGSHRMKGYDPGTGISVVLTTEAWSDADYLEQDITIVHFLVANMGTKPVLLAPGDFELTDLRGFRYQLLDAGGSFTTVPEGVDPDDVPSQGYDPGRSTEFLSMRSSLPSFSQAALPWGTIQPGTQMRGFVYFERLTDAANHATLIWRAQTPEHNQLANFAFKLHVARL